MIHIAKRKEMPLLQSMAIRGLSVVLALVICGVITTILTGLNPIDVYVTFFSGAFGSARKIGFCCRRLPSCCASRLPSRLPSR